LSVSSNNERSDQWRACFCLSDLRHAVQREFCQRIGFDDFSYRGTRQATDGAKGSIPQQLAPLDILNCLLTRRKSAPKKNPFNGLGCFMDLPVQLTEHDFASESV
jgi:hypothetical protein